MQFSLYKKKTKKNTFTFHFRIQPRDVCVWTYVAYADFTNSMKRGSHSVYLLLTIIIKVAAKMLRKTKANQVLTAGMSKRCDFFSISILDAVTEQIRNKSNSNICCRWAFGLFVSRCVFASSKVENKKKQNIDYNQNLKSCFIDKRLYWELCRPISFT